MEQRIVVTGLGVLTSNAQSIEAFTEALRVGKSGIGEISQFDTGRYACKIAGEIKELPFEDDPVDELDRASKLATLAAEMAMSDSGLVQSAISPNRLGVILGTTCGGVLSLQKVSEALLTDEDSSRIPDWRIREMSFFAATNHVADRIGAQGPVLSATVACSSGTHAVGMGADFINAGRADAMLVGGVDVISHFIFRGFAALNGLGQPPYRAFDKNRNGVVLGEGSAFLLLESRQHALDRGASIYCEILGHSFNNDGLHIVNPNPTGEGIARSLKMAMKEAGISPGDIDHINAHGTGTRLNDSAETAGIKLALGDDAERIPVTSIKPMIGHTSGGAGAIELVASIIAMKHSFVPPTINYATSDPRCKLNISGDLRPMDLRTVVSANSGFGGSNAAVIIRRPSDEGPAHAASSDERVVITGVGLLLPKASPEADLWSRIQGPPATITAGQLGLEVPSFDFFAASGLTMTKDTRRMDLFSRYAAYGVHQAIQDAKIDAPELSDQLGLVVGSAYACLESNEKFSAGLRKLKVNPVIYQNTVSCAATGYICMLMGIKGPVSSINQGWISGSAAIAYGYDMVRSGRVRAMVAGGTERLCQLTRLSLDRAGLVSKSGCAKPLDEAADGIVPSEGSAYLVLESLSHAQARGAHIYGEMRGYGMSHCSGSAASSAIMRAYADAIFPLEKVTSLHIYAGASGAPALDRLEIEGASRALKHHGLTASMSSLKGVLGESLGCGGSMSAAYAALAFSRHKMVENTKWSPSLVLGDGLDSPSSSERTDDLGGILATSLDPDGGTVVLSFAPHD